MSDFSTRAREAAKREAQSKYGDDRRGDLLPSDYVRGGEKIGFRFGFTTAASRLPSEEEIARVLAAHSTGGVCTPDDPSLAWEAWLSEAHAVRGLIEKKMLTHTLPNWDSKPSTETLNQTPDLIGDEN